MLAQIHSLVTSVTRGLDERGGSKCVVKRSYEGERVWKVDVRSPNDPLMHIRALKSLG